MEKLEQLEKDFQEMRSDVSDIKTALLGSEYNDGKGFAYKVMEHDKRIDILEKSREFELKTQAEKEKAHAKNMAIIMCGFGGLAAIQTIATLVMFFYKH